MFKLLTLGYTSTNPVELKQFVETLDAFLCDIRFSPYSRYPGWQRQSLRELVGADRYAWIQALGNVNYRGGEIKLLDFGAGAELVERALIRKNVILLCGCAELLTCHRLVAANQLAEKLGVEVEHLEGFKAKRKIAV
jgi:uncharacterized protein (DUF488 family)